MQISDSRFCAFCGQSIPCSHDCPQEIFNLLNTLAEENIDPKYLFENVDNLVFQGGSVKGTAYIGVLEELLKENPEIFKHAQRFAGTSAGALVALYLSLNMSIQKIKLYIEEREYSQLLDHGLVLKVCTNPTEHAPIVFPYSFICPTTADIILSGVAYFDDIQEKLKDPSKWQELQTELRTMCENILRYYAYHLGESYNFFMSLKAKEFSRDAIKWLIRILKPEIENHLGVHDKLSTNKMSWHKGPLDANFPNTKTFSPNTLQNVLDQAFSEARERIRKEEEEKPEDERVLPKTDGTTPAANSQEYHHYAFYKSQVASPNDVKFQGFGQKSNGKLAGQELHYSLAELLWFILVCQRDSHGAKTELGLFSGDLIKSELIMRPIQDQLAQHNIENKNPTFRDLVSYKDENQNSLFKPLYITAYNTATLRTEVFSFEHTPNVIVADAVRASISIPIFFVPVTIRESSGFLRKIYFRGGEKSEEIRYMDGGVFDNYPIWIFDDLKYCLSDTMRKWKPEHKVSIHNPRTLGFKFLDASRIDIYQEPYFDSEHTKMKKISNISYESSFSSLMGPLANSLISEHEESDYINQGNWRRTAYINNLGIHPLAFSLTKEQKDALIAEGRYAVKNYRKRATDFNSEGIIYV